MHKNPEVRCKNCLFVVLFIPKGQVTGPLICRRMPPLMVPLFSKTGVMTNVMHPVVPEEFWCHEFEARKPDEEIFTESENTIESPAVKPAIQLVRK